MLFKCTMIPFRSFSKNTGFGPPPTVRASGGDTNVMHDDSLNRRMSFTVFAALLLEMFSRGKIPMTMILAAGLASAMVTVDLIMVLAIAIQLLLPFRRLLLPTQITAVFRFKTPVQVLCAISSDSGVEPAWQSFL